MNIWISRAQPPEVTADGPLAGRTVGVKDNIDVAGADTTAGCPSFAYRPAETATAVQRLVDAGAVVVGKTNLDQFATGLVGTRSPYGVVANPRAPGLVSGGSSSGSAAAVACGHVDLGVGTDTAGSGRVPAAFCGVVGLKGTRGWVPNRGVVPACPSFDCTTVFATSVGAAAEALEIMAGPEPGDPSSRPPPVAEAAVVRRVGVPGADGLVDCDARTIVAFESAAQRAEALGFEVVSVDLQAYFAAGDLLYGGAFIAERAASVGAFLATEPPHVDPVVATIIAGAASYSAIDLARDRARLGRLRVDAAKVWGEVDAVLLPAAPFHPTVDAVIADPIGVNARLGRFVSGCNLVDWCAAAVPMPADDGLPFGVQVLGPAWSDRAIWAAAARLVGEPPPPEAATDRLSLAVVGAHLRGLPLHHQLTDRGASLVCTTTTAPVYRMVALDGPVPKPGLVRVGPGDGGAAIEVEVWSLPPADFGTFVAAVPAPLSIGTLELADGTSVSGFLCEPHAAVDAPDITGYGGWRRWLSRTS